MTSGRCLDQAVADPMHVASLIDVHLEGTEQLAEPLAEWTQRVVEPLRDLPPAPPGAPKIRIRFSPGVRPLGRKKSSIPGGFCEQGIWLADHLGRAAILPLADLDNRAVEVDPAMDPSFFVSWVYMPVVRAGLWRTDATLVHAATAEIEGRRVALTGWSGTGKTLILLELLKAGANLLGEDWLVLSGSGHVGQVTAHLEIMQFHWERVFRSPWPGKGGRAQRTGTRVAAWGSRRTRRMSFLSRGLARVEESWHPHTVHTSLQAVFPSARQADPGALDTLIVLDPDGRYPELTNEQAAEMWAAQSHTFLMGHATLEGALRYAHPGAVTRSLFPSFQEEHDLTVRALSGVRVWSAPFAPGRDDPSRVIESILAPSPRTVGTDADH